MQGNYACSQSTRLSAEWELTFHTAVWFFSFFLFFYSKKSNKTPPSHYPKSGAI